MNQRTTLLGILFLLLGGITLWLVMGRGEQKTTYDASDRQFAVEDASSIQKIFLADRRGNTTTLEREGDHWIYNGKSRANPNIMSNLLQVITNVELQYIPSSAATEPLVEDLATNGIKVEIYGRNDNLLKAYYVGGVTPDERGTFMIMEGAEQPYVTHIPQMVGGLRVRYALQGDEWRDKALFRLNPENITYVSIEYPKQRNKSFILEKEGGKYTVRPFFEITPGEKQEIPESRALQYLVGYREVYAEAFENENPLRDDFRQRIPFAIMTVRRSNGKETKLRVHPAKDRSAELADLNVRIERFLAEVEPGDDFMLLQERNIGQLMWAYKTFLK
jgi:hypothetical protein